MPENPTNTSEYPEPRSSRSLSSITDEHDPELDFDPEVMDTMSLGDCILYMNLISMRRQELHNKNTPPI